VLAVQSNNSISNLNSFNLPLLTSEVATLNAVAGLGDAKISFNRIDPSTILITNQMILDQALSGSKITPNTIPDQALMGISASKLIGLVLSSQIQSINAVQLAGVIQSNQINSTEVTPVLVAYRCGAGGTVQGTSAIDFETKVVDTHNAVVNAGNGLQLPGAGWKFIAPLAGVYSVSASSASVSGNFGTDAQWWMSVTVNTGVVCVFPDLWWLGGEGFMNSGGSCVVRLSLSDVVQLLVSETTPGPLSLRSDPAYNYMSIERLSS